MNKIIIGLIVISTAFVSCRKDEGNTPVSTKDSLYKNMVYKKSEINTKEISYTTRSNSQHIQYTSEQTGQTEITQATLSPQMDLYLPPNANTGKKKPLLVMIHGGAFVGGDKDDWKDAAYTYARAGYVCASLNYRLTKNAGNLNGNPQLRLFAVQCALEDIQNGIRYLKSKADNYLIDTTRIIVFGSSAGGALALLNAVEFDAHIGVNDLPGFSSKTNGSISTGASLINDDPVTQLWTIQYNSYDSPVLMFHPKERDSETGYTWTESAVPTQQAINNSGNSCILVAQPNMTHTVDLSLGGEYWQYLQPFLVEKLKIDEL